MSKARIVLATWIGVVMISAGIQNLSLVSYLADQVSQSHEDRMRALREFIPDAKSDEWELVTAGQRVQILKGERGKEGVLRFGTEVVSSDDGTLTALLGASPGASVSVMAMLEVLESTFEDRMASTEWQQRVSAMIPSFGFRLADHPALASRLREWTSKSLKLQTLGRCSSIVE